MTAAHQQVALMQKIKTRVLGCEGVVKQGLRSAQSQPLQQPRGAKRLDIPVLLLPPRGNSSRVLRNLLE